MRGRFLPIFIFLCFDLFKGEYISAVATDRAHPSIRTKTLHEPTTLNMYGVNAKDIYKKSSLKLER